MGMLSDRKWQKDVERSRFEAEQTLADLRERTDGLYQFASDDARQRDDGLYDGFDFDGLGEMRGTLYSIDLDDYSSKEVVFECDRWMRESFHDGFAPELLDIGEIDSSDPGVHVCLALEADIRILLGNMVAHMGGNDIGPVWLMWDFSSGKPKYTELYKELTSW